MTAVAVVADLMDGDDNVSGAILDDRMLVVGASKRGRSTFGRLKMKWPTATLHKRILIPTFWPCRISLPLPNNSKVLSVL